MGLDKVIVKAALTTLAAIGTLILFIVLGLCLIFPSTSMKFAYDMGMEKSCIHFAERAYRGSDDIYFIAYATEVAIEDRQTEKVVSCGEKFIADDSFETYCSLKGESYGQFIYGQVCVAKYQEGEKTEAVTLAYQSLNGSFPKGNAMVAVLLSALKAGDEATLAQVQEKLEEISVEGEEEVYLQQTLALLQN